LIICCRLIGLLITTKWRHMQTLLAFIHWQNCGRGWSHSALSPITSKMGNYFCINKPPCYIASRQGPLNLAVPPGHGNTVSMLHFWCSDLHGATNTKQLRQQNFCSRWTSPVELSFSPAAKSRHHLQTVQMTAEGTPFSGSMNMVLCDFWYAVPQKNAWYLCSPLVRNGQFCITVGPITRNTGILTKQVKSTGATWTASWPVCWLFGFHLLAVSCHAKDVTVYAEVFFLWCIKCMCVVDVMCLQLVDRDVGHIKLQYLGTLVSCFALSSMN